MKEQKITIAILLCVSIFLFQGCSLLNIPGAMIGGTFQLLGALLEVIKKVPIPPPWVFL